MSILMCKIGFWGKEVSVVPLCPRAFRFSKKDLGFDLIADRLQ